MTCHISPDSCALRGRARAAADMHDALTGTRPVVVFNPAAGDLATGFGICESCFVIT
jgi:hypothetical protein